MNLRKYIIALVAVLALGLGVVKAVRAQTAPQIGTATEQFIERQSPSAIPESVRFTMLPVWQRWFVSLGWIIVVTVGFSIGVGFSLFVFDIITTDIEEWKEIEKGNIPVAIVFASIILAVGIIVYTVI